MKNNKENGASDEKLAQKVRNACIDAARKGFRDASMSGLCAEGAMEAAISAMENLDMDQIIRGK
jgi:hypothetical protein